MRYWNGELVACEPPQASRWEEEIGDVIAGDSDGNVNRWRIVERRKIYDIDEWLTVERPNRHRVQAVYPDYRVARSDLARLRRQRPDTEYRLIQELTQLTVCDE